VKTAQPKSPRQNWPVPLLAACLSSLALAVGLQQQSASATDEQTLAQTIQTLCQPPLPSTAPLDLTALNPKAPSPPPGVITAETISQRGLTVPSLWWAKEQFGGKLLQNWLAYPGAGEARGRVDLIVNRQFWSLLNYLERYRFVNQFGLVSRDYRYNVRVFHKRGTFLAAYTCAGPSTDPVCRICLESAGSAGMSGNP
jgi:hypothetical protein